MFTKWANWVLAVKLCLPNLICVYAANKHPGHLFEDSDCNGNLLSLAIFPWNHSHLIRHFPMLHFLSCKYSIHVILFHEWTVNIIFLIRVTHSGLFFWADVQFHRNNYKRYTTIFQGSRGQPSHHKSDLKGIKTSETKHLHYMTRLPTVITSQIRD